ncbi:hypothetical protein K2173_028291 [Erythroxylum novogranatense]|uniref:PITH domain-containing protein n=1 Tax=Erythroxylum novogranatense TaxID=1862640 RepID=A0AAV8U4S2_9ROSI|nr:hypothetical protein K2173_028291 [Erythroxylum novogranatense]
MTLESTSAIQRSQSRIECLNQSTNLLQFSLLIYIPFLQVVKLFSVVIKGLEEEGICKLNFPCDASINVNDFPPSDTVVLSSDDLKGKLVVLKYAKFQNVRSLTVFLEDNQSSSEITKVQKIALVRTT